MLVFEIACDAWEIKEEIESSFAHEIVRISDIDSLDGNDFMQILVPLASVIMPIISQIIQKYLDNDRVTIKYDGIEISALGYEKAMKILEKALSNKESSEDSNEN